MGGKNQFNPIHDEENIKVMSAFLKQKKIHPQSGIFDGSCIRHDFNLGVGENLCEGHHISTCEGCMRKTLSNVHILLEK